MTARASLLTPLEQGLTGGLVEYQLFCCHNLLISFWLIVFERLSDVIR